MPARIPRLYSSVPPGLPNLDRYRGDCKSRITAGCWDSNRSQQPTVYGIFSTREWDFKRRPCDASAREKIVSIAAHVCPGATSHKFEDLFSGVSFTVGLPYGHLIN